MIENAPPSELKPTSSNERTFGAFRKVPKTGVIYVTTEASRAGFRPGDSTSESDWCNLGQGQPETGELIGAPPRCQAVSIAGDDQDYAPVAGLWELREAVASMYNQMYRRGMPSQYSAENVCISGGGRAALTRVAAALGHVNLGHFLPDYTAYEELLDIFRLFSPIPILLEGDRKYSFSPSDLLREIQGRGLSAILMSNPCNPTGKHVRGRELAEWVSIAKHFDCALILDEFYSHYVYGFQESMESAARYVENVDEDPILILDGLTKNWRYPGWRVTWTVGPKAIMEAISSAGSFLDGGGSKPMQRAAVELLDLHHTMTETEAIHQTFLKKRDYLLNELARLGIVADLPPEGTFYVWGSVANLPSGMNDGRSFFRTALEHKVITVPGEFFDVNPGKRRAGRLSRFRNYVRFSFGPNDGVLSRAIGRLQQLIQR